MKKVLDEKRVNMIEKKIAVEDLFTVAQRKLMDKAITTSQSTLLLSRGKIDHPDYISPDDGDVGDDDDDESSFNYSMSSRSQFWYGKSDYSLVSDRSAVSSSSRYITPKEMVHEITERVRNHLAPPDYGNPLLLSGRKQKEFYFNLSFY